MKMLLSYVERTWTIGTISSRPKAPFAPSIYTCGPWAMGSRPGAATSVALAGRGGSSAGVTVRISTVGAACGSAAIPAVPARNIPSADRYVRRKIICLTSVFPSEKGEDHDLQVQEDAPVLEIKEVRPDAFAQVRIAAEALYLRQTRDARLRIVPRVVVRYLLLEILDQFRALGPGAHEAHVPLQHVPELRHLVDIPRPHEGSHTQAPRVVLDGPLRAGAALGIQPHAADLEHLEGLAVAAHPPLAIENRAGRFEVNQEAEDRDERRGKDQPDDRAEDIEQAFQQEVRRHIQRQLRNSQHRHAADRFQMQAGDQDLKIGGDDLELDHRLLAKIGQADDLALHAIHVAQENHVDRPVAEDIGEVRVIAQHRHGRLPVKLRSRGRDAARHLVGMDGVRLETVVQLLRLLIPADEQDALAQRDGYLRVLQEPVKNVTPAEQAERHVRRRDHHEDARDGRLRSEEHTSE